VFEKRVVGSCDFVGNPTKPNPHTGGIESVCAILSLPMSYVAMESGHAGAGKVKINQEVQGSNFRRETDDLGRTFNSLQPKLC
jgi:hypothetical protein